MNTRAGADIDHMIRRQNGVLVVLDHQHGIAEVAKTLERHQQPLVVLLVQTDGGLVQHVEHAGQPRTNL